MYLNSLCILFLAVLPAVALADDDVYAQLERNGEELAKRCGCRGCQCKNGQPCRASGTACKCSACKCVKRQEPAAARPRFPAWEQAAASPQASTLPLVVFCGVPAREVKGALVCTHDAWPAGVYVCQWNGGSGLFNRWKGFQINAGDEDLLAVTRPVVPAPPAVMQWQPQTFGGGGARGCSS